MVTVVSAILLILETHVTSVSSNVFLMLFFRLPRVQLHRSIKYIRLS